MEPRPPRRPRETLVDIDNPDDAEVLPESLTGDDDTLVAVDSPDDVTEEAPDDEERRRD